ncbi:selenium metabolism-associated LysR family transcriptional regulator [Facklamia sp. P12950]|uniref:selenium metabolism-associated LysR family transcriptional regulator n=1 Tax=unclassified Facklamia TaxID=2622293 RepID=UPI003D1843F7
MELKQIQTFITIVEWGSFSEAANQLYLSQPTVSLHIKQLENELGIELISRTTKSHELTTQGQEFYKYAQSLLKMSRNIETTFSQRNNHEITIGASSIAASYLLPLALSEFAKNNKEMRVSLHQSDTIDIINDIALGSLNIGIVGSQSMNSNLTFEKLFSDKLVIVTPYNQEFIQYKETAYPIKKILEKPFITREEGSGTLKESALILRELDIDPLKLNKVFEVNNNETIKQFIKLGVGISILSELAVQPDVKHKEVLTFDIEGVNSIRNFYLVYRKNTHLPESVKNFINYIRNYQLSVEPFQSDQSIN